MSGIALNGIASGLDTAKMIEQLMQLERIPYNKLQTRKTTITENQSIIRTLNTKLNALKNAAADLMYTSAFNQTTAKVSDSSVVKVSSTDTAAAGGYELQVVQLAKKHIVSSKEFDASAASAVSGKFTLSSKDKSVEIELKSGADVTYEQMLNQLKEDINKAEAGVTASLIETSPGKLTLVLTADDYGTEMKIGSSSGSEDNNVYFGGDYAALVALRDVGIKKPGVSEVNERQAAQNAQVILNGVTVEAEGNTLKDVVKGLTIDLLKEGSSTVTVAKDADKVASKIQAFVDAYNDVITHIRTNTAKGASLQGDSTLRMLQQELSNYVNNFVGRKAGGQNSDYAGALNLLSDIGIEIDKGITSGSEMTGKISFDKSKFTEVFNKDPDSIYHLFAYDGADNSNDGVAVRFFNGLSNWTRTGSGLLAFKLSGYDSDIKYITEQMENMSRLLENKQKQMEAQFAAMESALLSLQNQQSWLNSQIAGLMANY